MLHVARLPLDQISLHARCSLAPHGRILQIGLGDRIIVGIRTSFEFPTGVGEAVMLFGGPDNCRVVALEDIGNPPALDITKLIRIVAIDPAPFDAMGNATTLGSMYFHESTSSFIARGEVIHRNQIRQPTFVYLESGSDPTLAGRCVTSFGQITIRGVSKLFEIELIHPSDQ